MGNHWAPGADELLVPKKLPCTISTVSDPGINVDLATLERHVCVNVYLLLVPTWLRICVAALPPSSTEFK